MPLSNYRYAYGAGAAPFSRPPFDQDHYREFDPDFYEDALADPEDQNHQIDADSDAHAFAYISDQDIGPYPVDASPRVSASLTPPVHDWNNGLVEVYTSGSEGGREEHDSEDDREQIPWASDSEDDIIDQEDHNEAEVLDLQSPPYAYVYDNAHDRDDHESIREPSVEYDDDDDDDGSNLSCTISHSSDGEGHGPTPSLSPSPPASVHYYDSESPARSDSDQITISDLEAESLSSPATASPQSSGSAPASASASASASSSQGPGHEPSGPLPRWDPGDRVSDLLEIDIDDDDYYNNDHPPPRGPSLTPVYHPNRRLPRRQSSAHLDRRAVREETPDSASSEDEPIVQRPQRRLGIERTRRPRTSNPARVVLDISEEEDEDNEEHPASVLPDSSGDESLQPTPRPCRRGPAYQRRRRPASDEESDHSGHSHRRNNYYIEEERFDDHIEEEPSDDHGEEEASDNLYQSDLEELSDDLSQNGESQADESGEEREIFHIPDSEDEDEDEGDRADRVRAQLRELGRLRLERLRGGREALVRPQALDTAIRWGQVRRSPADERRVLEQFVLDRQEAQREADVWEALSADQDLLDDEHENAAVRQRGAARNPFLGESDSGEDMDVDDELVEVVFDNLDQRHEQRQNNQRYNGQARNIQGRAVDIIDLTEEPDSPMQQHRLFQNQANDNRRQHRAAGHPRRMAQNGRPPSLARSDGSFLGNPGRAVELIDLTNDDDPADAGNDDVHDGLFVRQNNHIPANRRLPHPVPPQRRNNRHGAPSGGILEIARHMAGRLGRIGEFVANFQVLPDDIAIIGGEPLYEPDFNMNPNPLAGNPPNFNYQANGFAGRPPPPKPQFEEPPPARPGFTRNTGPDSTTGEEQKFICAGCDGELKYYEDDDDGERPAKRPRTKKAREQHHFWAVKACGHVYCKNCYDNRRSVKKMGSEYSKQMAFRTEQSASAKTPKIFCAVDDCPSDVTTTNAWVGIFM